MGDVVLAQARSMSLLRITASLLAAAIFHGCTADQSFDPPQEPMPPMDTSMPGPIARVGDDVIMANLPSSADAEVMEECVNDRDTDGYYGGTECPSASELSPFGFDCNDDDSRVHGHSPESCDGVDEDCDMRVDEGRDCDVEVELSAEAMALDGLFWPGYTDVATDPQGNRYAIGHNAYGAARPDAWIILSQEGAAGGFWTSRYSFALDAQEAGLEDVAFAVAHGRIYVIASGGVELSLPSGVPETVHDTFVMALDANTSTMLWMTPFDWAPAPQGARVGRQLAIAAADDGIYVAAPVGDEAGGTFRYAKLETSGAIAWEREPERIGTPSDFDDTTPFALAATSTGELYLAGATSLPLRWEGCEIGAGRSFIVALDPGGVCRWQIESSESVQAAVGSSVRISSLATTPEGGVVAAGASIGTNDFAGETFVAETYDPLPSSIAFVLSIAADANVHFARSYVLGPHEHEANDVFVGPDGGIYVGLGIDHDIEGIDTWPVEGGFGIGQLGIVSHLDAAGDELWSRDVVLPEPSQHSRIASVAVLPDGSVLAVSSGTRVRLHP